MYDRKNTLTPGLQYCRVRNRRTVYGDKKDSMDDRPSSAYEEYMMKTELAKRQKVQLIHLQMVRDREICYGRKTMKNPREASVLLKGLIGEIDRECLVVCATDTKMKPTYIQIVSMGTIDCCPASMPDIFKAALLSNSVNILLAHNHLSGDCIFSQEDISLTEKVLEAGRMLDIRLIDHIILGEGDMFCSLRESGRISGWQCMDR